MKIGLITNLDERAERLTGRGITQAGYLIQLALAWFGLTGLELRNDVGVITTQKSEDLEAATLASSCSTGFGKGGLRIQWMPKDPAELVEMLTLNRKELFLAFAFFHPDHNVASLLQAWNIPMPEEWPSVNQAVLVRIDTEAKTVEIDYAPFPPHGNNM